jgi:hypothetical protein
VELKLWILLSWPRCRVRVINDMKCKRYIRHEIYEK